MKRCIGILVALSAIGFALGQGSFSIYRPQNNAKVREVVRVQIPKGGVQGENFVGVYIDGKFIEATVLTAKGDFMEYALDTKARKIPDGSHELKLVLYSGTSDKARILDSSSVTISVQNSASIKVPEDGFNLAYNWKTGQRLLYNVEAKGTVNAISEQSARSGARSAELPIESDRFRYEYSVDNAYANGDGLLRLSLLPQAGRDSILFKLLHTSDGQTKEGERIPVDELGQVYMQLDKLGNEKYSAIPFFMNPFGTGAAGMKYNVFLVLPMPRLPAFPVKPGGSFNGKILVDQFDATKLDEVRRLTIPMDCRGEFVGAEWEAGHPCAKLRYSITAQPMKPQAGASTEGLGGEKISIEQTVWFALDLGVPVRVELDETIDTRGQVSTGGGMGAPAGMGAPGQSGGRGRMGPPGDDNDFMTGPLRDRQGRSLPGQSGPPAGFRPPQGPPGSPQGGNFGPPSGMGGAPPGRAGGGGQATQSEFIRLRIKFTMILQQ